MNIGFIGYGEAAFNISLGLRGEGILGIRANDAMMNHEVMGKQVHSRAEQAGVTLVSSAKELAQWADVLFAAVPSSFTLDVCSEIKDVLRPGQLYVDVSASTPIAKEAIWTAIKDTGVLFVDAAICSFRCFSSATRPTASPSSLVSSPSCCPWRWTPCSYSPFRCPFPRASGDSERRV